MAAFPDPSCSRSCWVVSRWLPRALATRDRGGLRHSPSARRSLLEMGRPCGLACFLHEQVGQRTKRVASWMEEQGTGWHYNDRSGIDRRLGAGRRISGYAEPTLRPQCLSMPLRLFQHLEHHPPRERFWAGCAAALTARKLI